MIIKEIEKLIIFRLSHLQNPLCNKSKKKKRRGYRGSFLIFLTVSGLSCRTQILWLRHVSSVVVARGLSCPTACRISDPQPGIESTSPALEGGFLTNRPPGKSLLFY